MKKAKTGKEELPLTFQSQCHWWRVVSSKLTAHYVHRPDIKPAERWHESHWSSARRVTSYQETLHTTETYAGAKRHKSCNRNNTWHSACPYGTDTSSWHRFSHQEMCIAKLQKKKKKKIQLRNNPRSQQRALEFTLTADWAAWRVPEQITATLQQCLYEEISFALNRHEKQN